MERLTIFLCTGLLLIGCRSDQHLPRSLQGEGQHRSMRQAIGMVQSGRPPVVYQAFSQGKSGEKERQWTQIDSIGPQQYHSLEVYNVYVDQQQRTEYFVQEFTINLADTLARFQVQDDRFLATADTAYYTSRTQRGVRIRQVYHLRDGVDVYEMEGFEYLDSPSYGQLKYWHPQIGTILQYFGQGETFELVRTGDPRLNQALTAWRQEIRSLIQE